MTGLWRRLARPWRNAARIVAEEQALALTRAPAPAPRPGQAPATAPAPGHRHPPGAAASPGRPAPAPGHLRPPGHDHRGLYYVVRVYNCGCIHLHDGHGRLTGCTPCQPPDLDEELRRMTTDGI